MSPAELVEEFRRDMADTVAPYLWTDEEIISYLDDAQCVFAQLVGGLADSTSSLAKLTLTAGKEWYQISPRILKLRSAARTDTGRPIDVLTAEQASLRGVRFDKRSGPPRLLVQGLEDGKLRAYPVPNEDVALELHILRLPNAPIVDGECRIEVAVQHRRPLLLWVKARAHRKPDAEVMNSVKADDYEQAFRQYCQQARNELSRQRRSAGTVSYGGL